MKYAIIGAGWAGCSAAVCLAQKGHEVHLIEAAHTLGGRARQVLPQPTSSAPTKLPAPLLDNGQHMLLGAYTATFHLLKQLGVHPDTAFIKLPLQLCYPNQTHTLGLTTPNLKAPWHLLFGVLCAKGCTLREKIALIRFISALRGMNWQLARDTTVLLLLQNFKQPERIIHLIWRPICLAALNTPIALASAQVFIYILRDSLGGTHHASSLFIPRIDLTTLLPEPAAQFIRERGGKVVTDCHVKGVTYQNNQWHIDTRTSPHASLPDSFDGIVLATPPEATKKILASLGWESLIPDFNYYPITTCYLQYRSEVRLSQPFFALEDNIYKQAFGQFVFDRGYSHQQPGRLAVVVSAAERVLGMSQSGLAHACMQQLAEAFSDSLFAHPIWYWVATEKRATFAALPNLTRPTLTLPLPSMVLAGDYIQHPYPATLETAVQNGLFAATCLDSKDSS